MTIRLGKGAVAGTNAPGGGWAIGRALVSTQGTFNLTKVGFRATAINATHTSTYRVAVYANNSGVPGALLGNSLEVGFSDGIVAASATEFEVSLITPVSITLGTVYFVVLLQHPNSDLTMQLDDGTGTDSANTTGYYKPSTNADTVPPSPWGSGNIVGGTPWMIWAVGDDPVVPVVFDAARVELEVTYTCKPALDAARVDLEVMYSTAEVADVARVTLEVFHSKHGTGDGPVDPRPTSRRDVPVWSIIRHAV